MKRSTCRSCDAPIIWAVTTREQLMPVDADPSTDGNVELVTRQLNVAPLAIVHAQPPLGAGPLRMPHHATCPDAAKWRRR